VLIKLSKVNYLSPDCQGFLINIARLLTIFGVGTKSSRTGRIITLIAFFCKGTGRIEDRQKSKKNSKEDRSEIICR
jgi:hypothetical protein